MKLQPGETKNYMVECNGRDATSPKQMYDYSLLIDVLSYCATKCICMYVCMYICMYIY